MSKNGKQKKRRLTLKQKKFAKAYLETGSETKAGTIAGYAHPMQQGHETLRKLEKREEFLKMMDRAGLSDRVLLQDAKAGLLATKKTYATSFGAIGDEREDPDYHARHKYLETALKLRGRLGRPEDEILPHGAHTQVIIVLSDGSQAARLRSPQSDGNGHP